MREETQKAFMNILDVFSGADGGVSFLRLKVSIEAFDQLASEGDKAAQQILNVMIRFSKLINVVQMEVR